MTSTATRLSMAARQNRRRPRGHAPGESRIGAMIFMIIVTIIVLTPFAWVVSLAFTPQLEAFGSVSLIPANPTWENFVTALVDANLGQAFINSSVVAIATVIANCVIAVLAGYAFAMLPFPGSNAVFYTLVATTAIPISVTLVPLFLMIRGVPFAGGNDIFGQGGSGLLDTLAGVMLPYLVAPMNIFLARQFFLSAPIELAEAARVDGAGEWRIFSKVYLPLARPLIAVVAVLSFTAAWDDFLWPLVVTNSPEIQTVQLTLARFASSGNPQFGPMMAGALISTIPVLIVFLFNQRSFISGLSEGSLKG